MSDNNYSISELMSYDKRSIELVDKLLLKEGIRRDKNIDYTCIVTDDDMNVIATGSCFKNTLRCMAVDSMHQGEGLMNTVVTHLMMKQFERGNVNVFLYTKPSSASFFTGLGFSEIIRMENHIVFMENKKDGFENFIKKLKKETIEARKYISISDNKKYKASAVVINANPFTLGHRYLIEEAAKESEILHVFMVSEDLSLVPFSIRRKLIMDGVSDIKNIVFHDSGSYIISLATFPAYFQKTEEDVIISEAGCDIEIFKRIAKALNIEARYVGSEKTSLVTSLYNKVMSENFPKSGIDFIEIERLKVDGETVSASTVRELIRSKEIEKAKKFLPESTYNFLICEDAKELIKRISSKASVIHY